MSQMNWPCFSVVINKLVQLFGLVTLKILIATLLTGCKTFFLKLERVWRWIIKYPCLKLFSILITYSTCILTLSTPKSDQNLISCYSIDQYNIKLPSDVNEKKILIRKIAFDPTTNSRNKLYRRSMTDSMENFHWAIGSERVIFSKNCILVIPGVKG